MFELIQVAPSAIKTSMYKRWVRWCTRTHTYYQGMMLPRIMTGEKVPGEDKRQTLGMAMVLAVIDMIIEGSGYNTAIVED